MPSSWQVWDFFQAYPKGALEGFEGLVLLEAFDALSLRLMKDHLVPGGERRPRLVMGGELPPRWVEDEFLTLGLFGNTDSFIVNHPDEASVTLKDELLRSDLQLQGRVLVLAFTAETAFLKKALKVAPHAQHLKLEAPRFWEIGKLVDFLASYFRLPLAVDAKQYLLEAVENDFASLYATFRLIKLNFPESSPVTFAQVRDLVAVDRLDQFALARELGKKAWPQFFERLLSIEHDFERYRQLFLFLQSHLAKLADPSYLAGKNRLSKYDQEIQTLGRHWRVRDASDCLRTLQRWEIASKLRDPLLLTELRQSHLRALRGDWSPAPVSKV